MADCNLNNLANAARSQRCTFGHIQGQPACGKSTKTVPALWSLLADDPSVTMIYIQPTEWQTALLSDFLEASGDVKLAAALHDERLKLWSFPAATDKMLAVKKPEDIGLKTVVCIDLEQAATARGEFLLACLLQLGLLAHGSGNTHLRFALITVGAGEHRYPALPLSLTPILLQADTDGVQVPDYWRVSDLATLNSVANRVVGTLEPLTLFGDGGVALLYLSGEDYDRFCQSPPVMTANFKSICVTASALSDPAAARAMKSFRGPGLVHVDPSITITLPFRNVRAVISSSSRFTPVLNHGQAPAADTPVRANSQNSTDQAGESQPPATSGNNPAEAGNHGRLDPSQTTSAAINAAAADQFPFANHVARVSDSGSNSGGDSEAGSDDENEEEEEEIRIPYDDSDEGGIEL